MPLKRSYYGIHQVLTGQYTPGGEYILKDGTDYIGLYHVLPNGKIFTQAQPNANSVELYIKQIDVSPDVLKYNMLTERDLPQYVSPVPYLPILTADDYERGVIERFFVQRKNNPLEIDVNQYNKMNRNNSPGINLDIYRGAVIEWHISVVSVGDAITLNMFNIRQAEYIIIGLSNYLTNLLEFYKA